VNVDWLESIELNRYFSGQISVQQCMKGVEH
jgi:hypothetical protein